MKKFTFYLEIKAKTLNEAIRDFREAVKEAVEEDEIMETFDFCEEEMKNEKKEEKE